MKILILHAGAGYGHQKIAEVIGRAFLERGLSREEVKVQDALASASWIFRKLYPAAYFYSVKYAPKFWGWFYETFDRPRPYGAIRGLRTATNRLVGGKILKQVTEESPDAIVCTHFFSAELLGRAKREGKIQAKLITVITDFLPHAFWVNAGTDFYWVMSEEGREDLVKRGVPATQVVAGGIPVDRNFMPSGRKHEILKKWGFEEGRMTLLMTSGSFGLGPQKATLEALAPFGERIQCFVVTGNNTKLRQGLEKMDHRIAVKIFGFVDFMAELMEASDLLIAKSGGSTTAESLAKGIPMVVLEPIPGQETRNAKLLKERNAAFFLHEPGQIKVILQALMNYPELRQEKSRAIRSLARPHAAEDLVSFVLKGKEL